MMESGGKYRHELKYRIGYAQYLVLRQRLRAVMKQDAHVRWDGRYMIRSIYFDNIHDKALREKKDGVAKREKFRIRYYNDDFSFIALEKKIKYNNLCQKFDEPISQEECAAMLGGDLGWMMGHPSQLVHELYCKIKYQQLRPRIVVSYVREPYIYSAGNVRVTFDSQIRTSLYHRKFLEPEAGDVSAMDSPGEMILEVKFDEFLPEVIGCLLQVGGIRQEAFSKYDICRRFG